MRAIHFPLLRLILLLCCCVVLQACATPGRTVSDDPWQGFNRGVYKFNDAVDRAALKPAAKGYQKVTPQWLRTGVANFLHNLELPWTMVNQLLQGKPRNMAQDTCRLVLNTVVGLGGTIDVATKLGLDRHKEDFGQTLAVWGVPSGPYLMLPFFGPSTLRDGVGRVPDYLLGRPTRYADLTDVESYSLTVVDVVDSRARLLSVEESLNQSYDRYGVIRDAWMQSREYQIFDGDPPVEIPTEDADTSSDAEADAEPAAADESTPAPPATEAAPSR